MASSNLNKYYYKDLSKLIKFVTSNNTNYFVFNNSLANVSDVQVFFEKLYKKTNQKSRILIIYYNHLWEPVLKLASYLGFRKETKEQNWLEEKDFISLLELSGFQIITSQKRMLLPIKILILSNLINKCLAFLPIFNSLCLTTYIIAKPNNIYKREYSVSIIVPAKNEEGNIEKIVNSFPKFGKSQEIIFVEGHSTDGTWNKIQILINEKRKDIIQVRAFKQHGKGKANAVRLGIKKSKGAIIIIYDADRTVDAVDLKKFYNVLTNNQGEFVNGSRMVYPMEKDAMRMLNMIGNKLFSVFFTWIFGQRFKDTLCGTKAFFKKDYLLFDRFKDDPFGDFELIFGAIKNNLKVIEIPVRYKERIYGSTNINRFKHGLLLFKMTWKAFKIFKAW